MALTFPNNPTTGQNYTAENGLQYQYDGEKWTTVGSSAATGDLTVQDGSITPAKLSTGGPSWTSGGNLAVTGNLNVGPGIDLGSDTANGLSAVGGGILYTQRVASSAEDVYSVYAGQIKNINFQADGSGSFAGRLGVGVSAPDSTLQVRGANGSKFEQSANSAQFFINPGATPSDGVQLTSTFGGAGSYGPLKFNTGGTDRATIDSAGRLLVGTATATGGSTVVLQGNSAGATGGSVLRMLRDTTPPAGQDLGVMIVGSSADQEAARILISSDDAWTPGTSTPTRIAFHTTPSGSTTPVERMRIGADGNLFTHVSSGKDTQVIRNGSSPGTTDKFIVAQHSCATIDSAGTASFYVYTNGDVTNTNNSYGAISDIKLKENIVDAKSQWDDIKGLRLVNYNFKAETGNQTHKQLGLIAQEVEAVCPGLVGETADVDENGDPTGEVTKNVAYSVLYMKAVGALQEAMAKIEDLQARVDALENPAP